MESEAPHVPRLLFACGTDNDGYPTCQGDGSACGPRDTCVMLEADE